MTSLVILSCSLTLALSALGYEVPEEARHPYVATYYVNPVVSPTTDTAIKFFVTDWDNSKVRFGDTGHRFTAELRYTADGTTWTTLTTNNLASGDHSLPLGRLPEGDYQLGLRVIDSLGRSSHTVWHEFRSRTAEEIPAEKTWQVTAQDLADFGLVPETNRYNFILVEASQDALTNKTNSVAMVKAEMEAAAQTLKPASGTYTIVAPASSGRLMYRSWKQSALAYAGDYDAEAIEKVAATNAVAMQALFNAASSRGYKKLVLPKEVFRISGYRSVTLPSNLTVDLNGATVKMNSTTNATGQVFVMTHARDAHLINGTIEGDYYEHDYANSPNNSEWVLGVCLEGDCRYSSLENLKVWRITGYGVSNGTRAYDHTFDGKIVYMYGSGVYSPGALSLADGSVDASAEGRYTSTFKDISTLTNGYLSVSKYLGYQGIRTKSWYYTAAFYDADKAYLQGEVAFQYRHVRVPSGAKYLRITICAEDQASADGCELTAQLFKFPWNCAYKNLTIELCRAVGMAPSAMRNMLIEDCDFSYSGDTLATCAFDAEDGWDQMQDVYIHRNVFHDNPMNELLTCAGHNFIIEDNVANIYLYARTCCPCVRGNTCKTATFCCDSSRNRTLHGRYENNLYGTTLTLGKSATPIDWDICISDDLTSYLPDTQLTVNTYETGRVRRNTLNNVKISNCSSTYEDVTFTNSNLVGTYSVNRFTNCKFVDCYLQHWCKTNRLWDCTMTNCHLVGMSGGTMYATNCVFQNTYFEPGYWALPLTLDLYGCAVTNENHYFFRPAAYTIGNIHVLDCDFHTGTSPVFDIFDMRTQATDNLVGNIWIGASTCSSGGFVTPSLGGSKTSVKFVNLVSCCNLYDGAFVTPERFVSALYSRGGTNYWQRTVVPADESGTVRPGDVVDIPLCRAERMAAISEALSFGLSEEDEAAGLDTAYLTFNKKKTATSLSISIGLNRTAIEATAGPLDFSTEEEELPAFETADGESTVSANVKQTIPGLWYGFVVSDSLTSGATFTPDANSFQRADASGTLRLTSSSCASSSAFFRLAIYPAKP